MASKQEEVYAFMAQQMGKGFNPEEDVVWGERNSQFQVPSRFDGLSAAGKALIAAGNALDEVASFDRTFNYRDGDVIVSGLRAMKKAFGMVTETRPWWQDANTREVKVGVGQVEVVPWGDWFQVPGFDEMHFYFDVVHHPIKGRLGQLRVTAPKKRVAQVHYIFKMIEEWLAEKSIYKGQAIDGQEEPDFIDVDSFDPSKLVYNESLLNDLMAKVMLPLSNPDLLKAEGIEAKRTALLDGEFGTGKTEFLMWMMQVAKANGHTVIVVKAGRDDPLKAMETADLYQPAFVVAEDLDTLASASESVDRIHKILEAFDGSSSKGREVYVAFTTNHSDKLHGGILRPGRIDHHIVMELPNEESRKRLVEVFIDKSRLDVSSEQWPDVVKSMEGMIPAFIKSACTDALLFAGRRNGKEGGWISAEDLIDAAHSLAKHRATLQAAMTEVKAPVLETIFSELIEGAVRSRFAHTGERMDELEEKIQAEANSINNNVDYEMTNTRTMIEAVQEIVESINDRV